MSGVLRVATRPSEVALRRARHVQAMLAARQVDSALVVIRTAGDRQFDGWISPAAARATFTKELDNALVKSKADVAVHAYSDVSTDPTPGVQTAAVLPRDDPRDALVLNSGIDAASIEELPRGTRIGTSNVHRRAMLLALYPQLEVVHLRGDLPTRLRKVDDGQVHATVVAAASLHLLAVSQRIASVLDPDRWLPVPAQGAVILQVREGDGATRALVAPLGHERTRLDTEAERAVLASLEGGLQSPLGALVMSDTGGRVLRAVIADLQGRRIVRAERAMDDASPDLVGVRLANDLRGRGASDILDEMRGALRIAAPQPD